MDAEASDSVAPGSGPATGATAGSSGAGATVTGAGFVAAALALMNVANYGFNIFAAWLLGPGAFGAFAALMAVLLVVNVLSLGMQATAARRISADPGSAGAVERGALRMGLRAGLVLGAVFLLLSPVLNLFLHLESLATASMVALAAVPLTIMGAQAGVLQGERRWRPLAAVYLTSGLGRILFGVLLVTLQPSEFTAMAGVAAGAWMPVLVGLWVLRPGHRAVSAPAPAEGGGLIAETLHNSHALLAFFAMSNVDMILARALFDAHDAGLYGAGLIMTKAVLFLPQFVVVVAFPSMADGAQPRAYLRGLAGTAAVGGVATAGAALLPTLALQFVGGAEYAAISPWLWCFAAVGTVLAMIQLMVYEVVARQSRTSVLWLWGGFTAIGLAASAVAEELLLLAAVALVDLVVLLVLFVEAWVRTSPGRVAALRPEGAGTPDEARA